MTFGQMLKQILSVCGIRLTHFANALGYDSSCDAILTIAHFFVRTNRFVHYNKKVRS